MTNVTRRRPLPPNVKSLTVPLERVFDASTKSNYEEDAQAFYSRPMLPVPPNPHPRDDSRAATVRESLTDLDAAWEEDEVTQLPDQDTMRPISTGPTGQDRPPTREWRFPAMASALSPEPDTRRRVATGSMAQHRPPTQEWRFPMMNLGPTSHHKETDEGLESDIPKLGLDYASGDDRFHAPQWKFPLITNRQNDSYMGPDEDTIRPQHERTPTKRVVKTDPLHRT